MWFAIKKYTLMIFKTEVWRKFLQIISMANELVMDQLTFQFQEILTVIMSSEPWKKFRLMNRLHESNIVSENCV